MDTIKDILTALLDRLGVSYTDISVGSIAEQAVLKVETDNGQMLIGPRGETLRALNYLVKKIAEQKGVENFHFLVDVNNYQSKQIEELQNKARMMAERARSLEYDVELTPMSSYERLIIHTTLANDGDITTESLGEGRNRRIVIKHKRM